MYTELDQIYTSKNNKNIIKAFFVWWFLTLPKKIIFISISYIRKLLRVFSFGILLKTLVSPWKRDMLDTRGLSLQQKFEIWTMNIISRIIGFFIRLITILIGLILTIFAIMVCTAFFIIMVFMPIFIVAVIILSY